MKGYRSTSRAILTIFLMLSVLIITLLPAWAKEEKPEASITGPKYGEVNQLLTFDALNSIPGDDREITAYRWSVKDASGKDVKFALAEEGKVISFAAKTSGDYNVELVVFDGLESEPLTYAVNVQKDLRRRITFLVEVPESTPANAQVYITGNHKTIGEYVPYSTPMKKVGKNSWEFSGLFELGKTLTYEYTLNWAVRGAKSDGQLIKNEVEIEANLKTLNDKIGTWEKIGDEPSFARLPYLSWTKDPKTTMTIRYGSETEKSEKVYYGIGNKLNKSAVTNSGSEKMVTLEGLKPGTQYSYRIGTNGKVYTFKTAPNKQTAFQFVAFGDSRRPSDTETANPEVKSLINKDILKEKPAFILSTGDLVFDGWQINEWKNDFFAIFGIMSPYAPFMAVPGNHENESGLFNYYLRYPGEGKWYTFAYANARIIGLDTGASITPGSPQYVFLEETLKKAKETWKIVYFHQPPYSTNTGHGSNLYVRQNICPLLEKYKVNLVFNGDDHCYERTKPITQNKVDMKNGVIYVVSGGAGAPLRDFKDESDLTPEEKAWVNVRYKEYHYLVIKIDGKKLSFIAKTPDGRILDKFELSK